MIRRGPGMAVNIEQRSPNISRKNATIGLYQIQQGDVFTSVRNPDLSFEVTRKRPNGSVRTVLQLGVSRDEGTDQPSLINLLMVLPAPDF